MAVPHVRSIGDLVGVGVLATAVCVGVVVFWFVAAAPEIGPDPADGRRLSTIYDPPATRVEGLFDLGDGQLFAAQATDPLARTPELVRGGPGTQAYRYQRGLYGWLGWVASGGQAGAVAWALIALGAGSAVLLTVVLADLLGQAGVEHRWSLVVLLLPGTLVGLTWVGPEILGTALVVVGLRAWLRPGGRLLLAVAAFAAAGLCRETFLLFPAVAALVELRARRCARAFTVAGAAVPYVAWVAYLRFQLGAWPGKSGEPAIDPVPFAGLLEGIGAWDPFDLLAALVVVGLGVAAVVRHHRSVATPFLLVHLVLAAFMGVAVWRRFVDYGRVLLPMTVVALVVLLLGDRIPSMRSVSDPARPTG